MTTESQRQHRRWPEVHPSEGFNHEHQHSKSSSFHTGFDKGACRVMEGPTNKKKEERRDPINKMKDSKGRITRWEKKPDKGNGVRAAELTRKLRGG